MIKLSKLAKHLGVTKATLYNWRLAGKISFIKSEGGQNYVSNETYNELLGIKEKKEDSVVIYCRVSSSENKNNLETQKERMISYCNAKGYKVHSVITEIGSGINDKRPKLQNLLKHNDDFTKIVVEHKDRLTRMGFGYIETLLNSLNKQIEVVNNVDGVKEDIIQDFVSIITSYCSKIYGDRRSKRNTELLIKNLQENNVA
jgi:predicted site-specific integrase-resolvase